MDDHGSGTTGPSEDPKLTASRLDQASKLVVDRLLEQGLDNPKSSEHDHDANREESLRELLGLLEHYPVHDASDELLDATLARVDRHQSAEESRMRISDANSGTMRSRWRFPDLLASAAALFLAVGIGWPVWQSIQNNRLQGTSQAHLNSIGTAIAGFAGDNFGQMPLDNSLLNQPFDPVKNPHSTHLINTLPSGNYLTENHLFLHKPTPNSGACFSYRMPSDVRQFRLLLMAPGTPIAGDKNPILWHLRAGDLNIKRLEGSPTHAGRGQVLLVGDLSTRWESVPLHQQDPIWTSEGCHEGEVPLCPPTHTQDTFLAD